MKIFTKAIAGFLLVIGISAIGLATLDLLNAKRDAAKKRGAMVALVVLGIVPAGVGGYLLWAMIDNARRQERGRLRAAFFQLVKAGQGRISAFDFAMETGLEIDDAKLYLDERAQKFYAASHIDDEGGIVYGFQLGHADPKTLFDSSDPTAPTYAVLLKTVPSEQEEGVLEVLQDLMQVDADSIKDVLGEPLLPVQIGVTQAIAQDYRKRLEDAGATVLVVLE
ncbi:MAG: hypothetical protein AAGA75_15725 [Cyanobacteria bacterium P01_E01_bin.6]